MRAYIQRTDEHRDLPLYNRAMHDKTTESGPFAHPPLHDRGSRNSLTPTPQFLPNHHSRSRRTPTRAVSVAGDGEAGCEQHSTVSQHTDHR